MNLSQPQTSAERRKRRTCGAQFASDESVPSTVSSPRPEAGFRRCWHGSERQTTCFHHCTYRLPLYQLICMGSPRSPCLIHTSCTTPAPRTHPANQTQTPNKALGEMHQEPEAWPSHHLVGCNSHCAYHQFPRRTVPGHNHFFDDRRDLPHNLMTGRKCESIVRTSLQSNPF